MKKFRFSLDTVLDYRRQVLDSLQVELGSIMAQIHQQEIEIEHARQKYAKINAEYCKKKMSGIHVGEIYGFETALQVQESLIRRELERLQSLQKQAEMKRSELVCAKQDASSVEKLREKKLQLYRHETQKSEEQYIDDLVCARSDFQRNAAL